MDKVALLFLTRKELNHSRIWQSLLEQAKDQFTVYIHSKEPMEDSYFKQFRIPTIVPTEYLYHGKAWQVLLQAALKDHRNVQFIYLSESCTPLYALTEIYHYLIRDPRSYMRYSAPWWLRDSEREIVEIPVEHRWGNAEWIILNRKHAGLVAEDQDILPLASRHMNSDHEGYPSSLLSLKGCLDEVIYRQTTYANFTPPEGPAPYHFRYDSPLEANYIHQAKRGGALFARKFTPEFPSERLLSIASERLLDPPSSIDVLSPELDRKIALLQSIEEMSQANSCSLLPILLNEGFFEVGYEIGVGVGLHMERLLESAFISHFYGIDDYQRKRYQGITFDEGEEEGLCRYVQERLKGAGLDAELIRASSLDFCKSLPDQTVDFIYFNTEHMSSPLDENLISWFPKIKGRGIIAGYQSSSFFPHLQPEVEVFFSNKNLEVHQEIVEPKLWWVQI